MSVHNQDTKKGDGVAIGSPNVIGRLVVFPELGDATEWHKYGADETYTVTALTRFLFRREVRQADGTIVAEEYDLQPETTIKRSGPFEHRVISQSEEPSLFPQGRGYGAEFCEVRRPIPGPPQFPWSYGVHQTKCCLRKISPGCVPSVRERCRA